MDWRCKLGWHAWGKSAQGETSESTKNMLLAIARIQNAPPGSTYIDAITPWFHTCKRCGITEQV